MASATVGALRAILSADTTEFDKSMKGADANVRKLVDTMQKQLAPSQARVNSLVKDFLGTREIGMAKAYAQAIEQVGDASAAAEEISRRVAAKKSERDADRARRGLPVGMGRRVAQG